jgi:hypothetical protein
MAADSLHTAIAYTVIATNSVTINLMTHAESPPGNETLCRSIIIHKAGTGTLALTKKNDKHETLTGLISGQELPVQAKKILPASAFSEILILW